MQDDLAVIAIPSYGGRVPALAAVSAIAEHSIMHQYATDRPNREDKDELRSFAGKDKCVRCGLCAERCPAQAISKENIKMIMKDRRFAFH